MANARTIVRYDIKRQGVQHGEQRAVTRFGLARIVGGINWQQTRTGVQFGIPYPFSPIWVTADNNIITADNNIITIDSNG
jgi:hypothetical protein